MPEQLSARQQRLAREKAVYQYITALEQGEIDTIAALLQQAEHDPTLEQMIMEAHEEYAREDQNAPQPGQIAAIRYKLLNVLSEQEEAGILASRPPARTRRRRIFIQSAVAVIIICALVGSALLLFAPRQPRTGGRPTPGTWKLVNGPNPGSANNGLQAISADAANDAWAVGSFSNIPYPGEDEKTLIERWNGFAWSVVKGQNAQIDNGSLSDVVALSPDDVWVIGNISRGNSSVSQPLVEHWNGHDWSIINISAPANSFLFDLAGVSSNDLWAVGGRSIAASGVNVQQILIEHWDGHFWKVVPSPKVVNGAGPEFTFLNHIVAVSANDVWAVGFSSNITVQNNQTALIEHWNGAAWTVVQGPKAGIGGFLYGISAVSAADIWSVGYVSASGVGGDSQQPLIEHWNGSSWSVVGSPNPATEGGTLDAVAARSANDVWAAGSTNSSPQQTLIEHWDGHSWTMVNSPNIDTNNPNVGPISNNLVSIATAPSSQLIWAVGDAENDNVTAPPAPTPTQFSPETSQTIIVSYGG